VNEPVDKRREMRLTTRFLWIPSRIAEEPQMAGRRPLRGARVCGRNIPPLETGTARGRPRERGRSRETGASHGYLAPAGGGRRRRGRATGQPGAARPGGAPPSHTWRGPADSARPESRAPARQGGNRRDGSGDDLGHDRVEARPLAGRRTRCLRSRRLVPACGCDNAGRAVTGRPARSSAPAARSPYRVRMT
jgi:hypothetical protein